LTREEVDRVRKKTFWPLLILISFILLETSSIVAQNNTTITEEEVRREGPFRGLFRGLGLGFGSGILMIGAVVLVGVIVILYLLFRPKNQAP
jgi:hypothetical protein